MPSVRSSVSPTPRSQVAVTARGLIAEVWPASLCDAATIPVANAASGTLVCGLIGLRAGDVVTNLWCHNANAATSITFAKMGLFTSGGVFLGASTSLSATANAGATTFKQFPLTAPFTIASDGGYYVGYLNWGSGATGLQLRIGGTATVANGAVLGSGVRSCALVAAQTDISGDVTLASDTTPYWFGVS